MKTKHLVFLLLAFFFLSACTVKRQIPSANQNIAQQINNSEINKQHQVGFVIREVGANQDLFSKNEDHYFTAASNTKLFTFYTALNLLGDSVPSLEYVIHKDSLIIWPMADASFLHPDFKSQPAFDFLKNSGKNIYLVSGRYDGEKFGKGWSWDDYNADYQKEITELPLYANGLKASTTNGKLKYQPDLAAMYLSETTTSAGIKEIKRSIENNNLTVPQNITSNYQQTIPIHFNKSVIENLLTDTLLATGLIIKPVVTLPWRPVPANSKVVYSLKTDSLYQHCLQPSDNFIAEEILLNCAAANHLSMNTQEMIKLAKDKYFSDLPDPIQWVDGSGLSRLNLFTPRDIAILLQEIYDKVGNQDRLFALLANGGKSGTIKNMFKGNAQPYVFAKSGSLSNNYNLSGYLIGKSGKKYVFSYMNNNYVQSTAAIRAEVERVLTFIHDNY